MEIQLGPLLSNITKELVSNLQIAKWLCMCVASKNITCHDIYDNLLRRHIAMLFQPHMSTLILNDDSGCSLTFLSSHCRPHYFDHIISLTDEICSFFIFYSQLRGARAGLDGKCKSSVNNLP